MTRLADEQAWIHHRAMTAVHSQAISPPAQCLSIWLELAWTGPVSTSTEYRLVMTTALRPDLFP